MAHLVTGYAGREHIKSEDQGSFNAAFFGDGQFVMGAGMKFDASIINNNTVRVLDGDLMMYGRHVRINKSVHEDLTITTGTAGYKRIDLICMTYEKNSNTGVETAYLEVVEGQAVSGTPEAPTIVNGNILSGATKNQMPLYSVAVDGVVLSGITKLFSVVESLSKQTENYMEELQEACEDAIAIGLNTKATVVFTTTEPVPGAVSPYDNGTLVAVYEE